MSLLGDQLENVKAASYKNFNIEGPVLELYLLLVLVFVVENPVVSCYNTWCIVEGRSVMICGFLNPCSSQFYQFRISENDGAP